MAASALSRRRTNITLPADLVAQAQELGVNVSQACEKGLAETVRAAREAQWLAENAEAIAAYNAYVDEHGLTFPEFRPIFD